MGKLSVVRVGVLVIGVGALLALCGAAMRVQAAYEAYLKIEGLDGSSKDPAHLNWIAVTRVVAGDLNGDAMADRESSAPSVSELTASEQASRKATGTTTSGQTGQASTAGSPSMVRESPTKASLGKTMASDSWSASNAKTSSAIQSPRDVATGQASGKRMHKPLVITKEWDASSPKLAQACATGKHFSSAEVDLGGRHYKLYDVMIASDQKSGGDRPMETITLNFTKIEMK